MALNYLTDAINIKSYDLKESDKIILMYSKDKGLIKGVAKGAKKMKSTLSGRMDTFVANKLMLYKGKTLDTICQAQALNTFNSLRSDMDKMMYALYLAELVYVFGIENDPNSEEIYDLFYAALLQISKSVTIEGILLAVMRFQLKFMKICGFELQLNSCINCGKLLERNKIILSFEKGGTFCSDCASGISKNRDFIGGIKIPKKLIDFWLVLVASDFTEMSYYDQKADERTCKYCFSLLEKYVSLHSDKRIKTSKLL